MQFLTKRQFAWRRLNALQHTTTATYPATSTALTQLVVMQSVCFQRAERHVLQTDDSILPKQAAYREVEQGEMVPPVSVIGLATQYWNKKQKLGS